jgi:hypothetical protein
MKNLKLNNDISRTWLKKAPIKFGNYLIHLDNIGYWDEARSGDIMYIDYVLNNNKSITQKYAKMICLITNKFEVVGIWRKMLSIDTTKNVVGLRLYGYKKDISLVIKVLHYLLDGLELYNEKVVTLLRHSKLNRRRRQREDYQRKPDVRKSVHKRILKAIAIIENILEKTEIRNSAFHKIKLERIFKRIRESEKIDFKNHPTMNDPTIWAMRSRFGFININRTT